MDITQSYSNNWAYDTYILERFSSSVSSRDFISEVSFVCYKGFLDKCFGYVGNRNVEELDQVGAHHEEVSFEIPDW